MNGLWVMLAETAAVASEGCARNTSGQLNHARPSAMQGKIHPCRDNSWLSIIEPDRQNGALVQGSAHSEMTPDHTLNLLSMPPTTIAFNAAKRYVREHLTKLAGFALPNGSMSTDQFGVSFDKDCVANCHSRRDEVAITI